MEKFKNIFISLERSWLIRHYIFSFAFLAFMLYSSFDSQGFSFILFLFFLLTALFYPFAMFVYESTVRLIMGDSIFLIPILLMLLWKALRFLLIWTLAIPIGFIGLIYLYFAVNRPSD